MAEVSIDKVTFPVDKIQASLKLHGIYAIPDEWKATDDANPGLFTYTVRMSKFQITKGKICPKQLTQKQKKQAQQKNKKGGKKQSKNPQPNEEQQRLRKIEQQRQRQRQQLFAKMTEQEQFYYNSEDIYRAPFLKFQQNTKDSQFQGNQCLIFQQRLVKDKGDWIYIYKMPTASEDELAKMRKSKPKTLANINDLNPVIMRAWVSFQELTTGDDKIQIKQLRCKIHQVDKTPQTPEPNLQKTYVKLTFSLSEPIIRQKDSYSTASLIKDPVKPKQKLPQQKALESLKEQIGLAVQSLAMEFSTMFWKDLNLQQDQRHTQVFLNNKKSQLSKRKQQFLYDFNITGKYKILKDRIKKCIVSLCQTKYKQFFTGMKSFNGIKCNSQDQIYSQIYNLLVVSYQDTIFKIIHEKQQSLGEVLVLNNETIKLQRQDILTTYKQQTIVQRVKRTTKQYELILNNSYGEQAVRKYLQQYPQIPQLKYIYGTYCLKYNLRPAKQVLPFIEQFLTLQKYTLTEEKKTEYMLILLNAGGQGYLKGWIILREVIENLLAQSEGNTLTQSLCRWLILASVVLKNMGQEGLALKYKSFALRQYKKLAQTDTKAQNINVTPSHKQSPSKTQIPTLTSVASYQQTSTPQDLNKLYDNLIQYLGGYSAFQLIKIIMQEKPQSEQAQNQNNQVSLQKALPEINQLLVSNSQSSSQKLLQLTSSLYQQSSSSKNQQEKNKILELVIKSYLFKLNHNKNIEDIKVLQNYLKKSLMTNNAPINRFVTLLRMGYVYFLKQQYGNSRACLLKYFQKSKEYPDYLSGLSYKLLGISCLKLNKSSEAIQCFKQWNLSDIKCKSAWLYLALAYAHAQQLIVVNQCLTQYKKRCQSQPTSEEQSQIMSEIGLIAQKINEKGQYQGILKSKIIQTVKV